MNLLFNWKKYFKIKNRSIEGNIHLNLPISFLFAKYFKLAEEAQCTFPPLLCCTFFKEIFEHGATENKIHFYRSNDVT